MASDDRADCRWNARVIMYHADLEPMFSEFITAHPRCPKDPDLPAVRYAIKEFMEEQAPSIFFKERWAASYNPARKVTYVSWFLDTIAYFLDKLDFTIPSLWDGKRRTRCAIFTSSRSKDGLSRAHHWASPNGGEIRSAL